MANEFLCVLQWVNWLGAGWSCENENVIQFRATCV